MQGECHGIHKETNKKQEENHSIAFARWQVDGIIALSGNFNRCYGLLVSAIALGNHRCWCLFVAVAAGDFYTIVK